VPDDDRFIIVPYPPESVASGPDDHGRSPFSFRSALGLMSRWSEACDLSAVVEASLEDTKLHDVTEFGSMRIVLDW
jgi:hypothetical protein